MKKLNLKQFNILIWIALALVTLNSCKKDNDPQPLKSAQAVIPTIITHYHRAIDPNSCNAVEDLYIYDNNGVITMSDPIITAYPDTMIFNSIMNFNQLHNQLPIIVAGGITISGNTLTMRFLQTTYVNQLNPYCKVYSLIYNKVP